ncbi:hypothetical protein ILUMI_07759 [Ignelater luminosus]|uniref:HTH psq-type domain-containing protein n=1 Tax=Ignelater luminosus TaxID=2038154 RepID=A0A8K0D2X3_IGNLU|nr:hypothetical protein ILUMI_07759 [Ignelater luminosus]
MVRSRVRKTTLGQHSLENMQETVALVESGLSLRVVANRKHVNYMTLSRYVKKLENRTEEERENISFTPNYANKKMFSNDQEKELKEYIITYSKMSYGLDTVDCSKLAYYMAVFHKLKIPKSWNGFRQKKSKSDAAKTETISDESQSQFSDGTRVFCLDETGTTTVQKPKTILAAKGAKQLNKVTSAEQGTLVTTCCAVSASGSALPSVTDKAKDHEPFLKDQLSEDQPNLMNFQVKHLTPIKDDQLSNKGRKRGRSCIATDKPIKNKFEEAALKRVKNVKHKEKKLTAIDENSIAKDKGFKAKE